MAVRNRQKFFGGSVQPLITSRGLTLGAMPIAAGVKLDVLVRTVITLLEACAKSGGATGADCLEYFVLRSRKRGSPAGEGMPGVVAENIEKGAVFHHRPLIWPRREQPVLRPILAEVNAQPP